MRRRRDRRGQILPVVAFGLIVLLCAVGLAIDLGRAFLERRDSQGASDHAAMTAAFARCSGTSGGGAIAAGVASAATNGYDNDGTTNTVLVAAEGADAFRAEVTSYLETAFMRVVGISTVEVATEAAASCALGGTSSPGAIYAGGNNCTGGKYAFDVSGSTSRVFGGVHVNSDVNIGGSSNEFTDHPDPPPDDFTHVGALNPSLGSITSNGNTFEVGSPDQVPIPSPIWAAGWAPADITGVGTPPTAGSMLRAYYDLAAANGTLFTNQVTAITTDGVYYTSSTAGMDIGSVTGSVRNIVLVAPHGPIKISASSKTFNPFEHPSLPREGILMISSKVQSGIARCDTYSISISGSASNWNGIMWAPGGLVEMSGSSNTALNGSLVGWAVRLNGSDLTINYNPDLFQDVGDVRLLR